MSVTRDDRGFTLVELLIAISILAVILPALDSVVIGYLRNQSATTSRLSESHDVQITSAYWAQDVASVGTRATTSPYALAQSVELNVAATGGLYACGTASTPTELVRLAWDDYPSGAGTPTVARVAYVVELVSNQRQLHRLRCNGSATPVSDIVVAHDLDPGTAPTVTCSTSCTAAPAVPASITLNLALKDAANTGTGYTAALTGRRRQS